MRHCRPLYLASHPMPSHSSPTASHTSPRLSHIHCTCMKPRGWLILLLLRYLARSTSRTRGFPTDVPGTRTRTTHSFSRQKPPRPPSVPCSRKKKNQSAHFKARHEETRVNQAPPFACRSPPHAPGPCWALYVCNHCQGPSAPVKSSQSTATVWTRRRERQGGV